MPDSLFFCFGPPKSGTTFLQRTLNLHPEISCPSEQRLDFLSDHIKKLTRQYNSVLQLVDRRTGGQGSTPLSENLAIHTWKVMVEAVLCEAAGDCRIAGANDNGILQQFELYQTLFPAARFLAIFRNPVDMALSSWHHNMRLAELENNPQHKEMMTRHGGLADWVKVIAKVFQQSLERCQRWQSEHESLMILRYEELRLQKRETLQAVCDFLGAASDEATLAPVLEQSELEVMRSASAQQEFFRAGSTDMGGGLFSEEVLEEVKAIAGPGLESLGYAL